VSVAQEARSVNTDTSEGGGPARIGTDEAPTPQLTYSLIGPTS
jgi:hypothetical protein